MLMGKAPFEDKNRNIVKERILNVEIIIHRSTTYSSTTQTMSQKRPENSSKPSSKKMPTNALK